MMDEFADMPVVEPGEYEHFKGKRYQVFGVGTHSETHEYFVVYKPLYAVPGRQPDFWVRPYDMFTETVERDGKVIPRFKKVAG